MSNRVSQCRGGKMFEVLGRRLHDSVNVKRASQMFTMSQADLDYLGKIEAQERDIPLKSSPGQKERRFGNLTQQLTSASDAGGSEYERSLLKNRSLTSQSKRSNLEGRESGKVSQVSSILAENASNPLAEIGGLVLKALTKSSVELSEQRDSVKTVWDEIISKLSTPDEVSSPDQTKLEKLQNTKNISSDATRRKERAEEGKPGVHGRPDISEYRTDERSFKSEGVSVQNEGTVTRTSDIVDILRKLLEEIQKISRLQEQQLQNAATPRFTREPPADAWKPQSRSQSGPVSSGNPIYDQAGTSEEQSERNERLSIPDALAEYVRQKISDSLNEDWRASDRLLRDNQSDLRLSNGRELADSRRFSDLSSVPEKEPVETSPIRDSYFSWPGSQGGRSTDVQQRGAEPTYLPYQKSLERIPFEVILNYIEEMLLTSRPPVNESASYPPRANSNKYRLQNDSSEAHSKERSYNHVRSYRDSNDHQDNVRKGSGTLDETRGYRDRPTNSESTNSKELLEHYRCDDENSHTLGVQTIPAIRLIRPRHSVTRPENANLYTDSSVVLDSRPSKLCVLKDITDELVFTKELVARESSSQTERSYPCNCSFSPNKKSETQLSIHVASHPASSQTADLKPCAAEDKNDDERDLLLSLCHKYLGSKDEPAFLKYSSAADKVVSPLPKFHRQSSLTSRIPIVRQIRNPVESDLPLYRETYRDNHLWSDDPVSQDKYLSHSHDPFLNQHNLSPSRQHDPFLSEQLPSRSHIYNTLLAQTLPPPSRPYDPSLNQYNIPHQYDIPSSSHNVILSYPYDTPVPQKLPPPSRPYDPSSNQYNLQRQYDTPLSPHNPIPSYPYDPLVGSLHSPPPHSYDHSISPHNLPRSLPYERPIPQHLPPPSHPYDPSSNQYNVSPSRQYDPPLSPHNPQLSYPYDPLVGHPSRPYSYDAAVSQLHPPSSHIYDPPEIQNYSPTSYPCACMSYSTCSRNVSNLYGNNRTKLKYDRPIPMKVEENRKKTPYHPPKDNCEPWKRSSKFQRLDKESKNINYSNFTEALGPTMTDNVSLTTLQKTKAKLQNQKMSNCMNSESSRRTYQLGSPTETNHEVQTTHIPAPVPHTTSHRRDSSYQKCLTDKNRLPMSLPCAVDIHLSVGRDMNKSAYTRATGDCDFDETWIEAKQVPAEDVHKHESESRESTPISSDNSILFHKMLARNVKDMQVQTTVEAVGRHTTERMNSRSRERYKDLAFLTKNSEMAFHPKHTCTTASDQKYGFKRAQYPIVDRRVDNSLVETRVPKVADGIFTKVCEGKWNETTKAISEGKEHHNQYKSKDEKNSSKFYCKRTNETSPNEPKRHLQDPYRGLPNRFADQKKSEVHQNQIQISPKTERTNEARVYSQVRAEATKVHQSTATVFWNGRDLQERADQLSSNKYFLYKTSRESGYSRLIGPHGNGCAANLEFWTQNRLPHSSFAWSMECQDPQNKKQLTNSSSKASLNDTSLFSEKSICINSQSGDFKLSMANQTVKPTTGSLSECDMTCCSEPINSLNEKGPSSVHGQRCDLHKASSNSIVV